MRFGVAKCRGPDTRHAWLVRGVQARRARRRTTEGDHAVRVRAPHSRLRPGHAPQAQRGREARQCRQPTCALTEHRTAPARGGARAGRAAPERPRLQAGLGRPAITCAEAHTLPPQPGKGAAARRQARSRSRQGGRLRTRPPRATPAHRARARASGPGKQDGVTAAACVSAASHAPASLLLRAARGARGADGPEPRRSGPRPASTWRGAPGPVCPRSSSVRDARCGAGGAAAPAAVGSQPCWVCSVSKGEARGALARARPEGMVPRAAGGAAAGPDGSSSR